MTREEIRLECLRLAVHAGRSETSVPNILYRASDLFDWVMLGAPDDGRIKGLIVHPPIEDGSDLLTVEGVKVEPSLPDYITDAAAADREMAAMRSREAVKPKAKK